MRNQLDHTCKVCNYESQNTFSEYLYLLGQLWLNDERAHLNLLTNYFNKISQCRSVYKDVVT